MPEIATENTGDLTDKKSAAQKQAARVFPVFPVSASAQSESTESNASTVDLPVPNWAMWRTRGACRIWKAVLISMSIKPTNPMRIRLQKEQPDRYAEYLRRKKDVVAQYGLHPELRATDHLNAGDKPGDQYIMLRSLLALGKEQRWKDIDAFEQGMSLTAAQSVAAARAHSSFEALPQGQRHALVRIGALLQLLENVLNKGVKMNAASLLSGGTLNISEVASQVEKIIGNAADQEKVENFAKEANRKQFGEAKQALRSFL